MSIRPLRSYRAHLIPAGADPAELETLADARQLPTVRVKAACNQSAQRAAHHVTGLPVLRAERIEEETAA